MTTAAWRLNLTNRGSQALSEIAIPDEYTHQLDESDKASSSAAGKGDALSSAKATTALKMKKAFELSYSPHSSIYMNLMMMWMTGNSINIFSIMFTVMMFVNPIKGIMGTSAAFAPLEDKAHTLILYKALYISIYLVNIAMAVYKCNLLGLLPNMPSDWLAWLVVPAHQEYSGGGPVFGSL